ncbi:LETM1-related biofilm-associated protein [Flavimarina sp. Hel_I_48]|uniref:LETM1-related biofilm-associated protein n=1 Tax=Flavimarina sp. Hel_I_48 TaxID=1392488 RepID=UPI0004DF81FB|nr:LETM1-related biofilm-associated protein [Flavimarina sp. Hel_I_48]
MNPSSAGWSVKQLRLLQNTSLKNSTNCYDATKKTGFIYGISVEVLTAQPLYLHTWSIEEITKVNLFDALAYTYKNYFPTFDNFIETTLSFYEQLSGNGTNPLKYHQSTKNSSLRLEKIIHERLKTNDSVLRKNFSASLTNALLYIDIITFDAFLDSGTAPRKKATDFEFLILNTICLAVQYKNQSGEQDKLLLQLFQKSLRYHKLHSTQVADLESLHLKNILKITEKRYILDITSLVFWNNFPKETQEDHFMFHLAQHLGLSSDNIAQIRENMTDFIDKHKSVIPYFNTAHPLKHLYDHTSSIVRTLILRNRKRLHKEILNSKDLVLLLGKSTYRDLSKEERKMVKNQLLDICKSVPSLAIFLLPGGTILLPLLIHYIPELLPSAFDENRIEDDLPEN